PLVAVVSVIVTGILAFLITGFIGYGYRECYAVIPGSTVSVAGKVGCFQDPWVHVLYLKEPWPLYLWFSMLMVLIEVAVLRAHLRRLIITLVVTLLSILIVAIVYLVGPQAVEDWLIKYPTGLVYQSATYVLLNFGLLGAFIVDSLRRWLLYGG